MEAKELMIGDLVTFKDCQNDEQPMVVKIYSLFGDGDASVLIDNDTTDELITIDDEVVGIPLSKEILEKNGFNEHPEWWHLSDDYYEILVRQWSDSIWLFNYQCLEMNTPFSQNTICYVHELQHILRIVGLSDLADNLKID